MRAAIDRRIPSGFLTDPHAVLHFGNDRAADRAMRADVLADGDAGAGRHGAGGLGVAHAGKRQSADRRQSACGETGATQEGPAIKTPDRLISKRGGEAAAALLAFCSSDEHGPPPSARIPVDPVVSLDFLGIGLVARLALLIVVFAV